MNLVYNGLALGSLGTLVVVSGPNASYEDQRKRVTLAVRLHVHQSTFAANRSQLSLLSAALRTQNATLLWTEDDGTPWVNRTARVTQHDFPEDPNAWGTYRQQLDVTFEWVENDVTPNTLPATFTPERLAPLVL